MNAKESAVIIDMSKYQSGDKVTVRSDLEHWEKYGGLTFVGIDGEDMAQYVGQVVTIEDVFVYRGDLYYEIAEDKDAYKWAWTDEMFEQKPPTSPPPRIISGG
ncbi:hypothetical protein AAXB25_15180 [Paenibacillus lautus]|uniref:hypothetical protein n=1 Tax=Paenibacillus lautus TaxID=1401 RepID=UPI003D27999E